MKKKRRNPIHAYKHLLAKDYDWDSEHHVTEEQMAKYTRMDADRLHQVLVGEVVMNINDYVDIPHSGESHIPAEKHGVENKLHF